MADGINLRACRPGSFLHMFKGQGDIQNWKNRSAPTGATFIELQISKQNMNIGATLHTNPLATKGGAPKGEIWLWIQTPCTYVSERDKNTPLKSDDKKINKYCSNHSHPRRLWVIKICPGDNTISLNFPGRWIRDAKHHFALKRDMTQHIVANITNCEYSHELHENKYPHGLHENESCFCEEP